METLLYTIMILGMALALREIPRSIKGIYKQLAHDYNTPGEWVE